MKFQIGDIVKLNERSPYHAGLVGEIVKYDPDNIENSYTIKTYTNPTKLQCFYTYKYSKISNEEAMLRKLESE
jgi:hypothetical protein